MPHNNPRRRMAYDRAFAAGLRAGRQSFTLTIFDPAGFCPLFNAPIAALAAFGGSFPLPGGSKALLLDQSRSNG